MNVPPDLADGTIDYMKLLLYFLSNDSGERPLAYTKDF